MLQADSGAHLASDPAVAPGRSTYFLCTGKDAQHNAEHAAEAWRGATNEAAQLEAHLVEGAQHCPDEPCCPDLRCVNCEQPKTVSGMRSFRSQTHERQCSIMTGAYMEIAGKTGNHCVRFGL